MKKGSSGLQAFFGGLKPREDIRQPTEVTQYLFSQTHNVEVRPWKVDADYSIEVPEWAAVNWINIDGLDRGIIEKMAKMFKLHPIAIGDAIDIQNRPKLDWYDDTLFLMTSMISKSETGPFALCTEQVSFFLTGNTLITIQEGLPGDVWEPIRQQLYLENSPIRKSDASFLFYALLEGMITTCEPIINELDDALQDLEMQMLARPSPKVNRMVYSIKRFQITLRSFLIPTRKALARLNKSSDEPSGPSQKLILRAHDANHSNISPESAPYFRDLVTELTTLIDRIEQQREIATATSGLWAEHISQRQGEVSYLIAIVSVFFLPLTFVAGVYGMNFTIMPELQWRLGYLYVWMIFIGVVLFEIVLFWLLGWINFGRLGEALKDKLTKRKKMVALPSKPADSSSSQKSILVAMEEHY